MVVLLVGILFPWIGMPHGLFSGGSSWLFQWIKYTLSEAARFAAINGTIMICSVGHPYLPFLNNWLISINRRKHQDKVLVISEDYATLYEVKERWPGHAVFVPPAPEAQTAHKFGFQVKPLNHSHALSPLRKKGRTYTCSCMIFLQLSSGAKRVMRKWINELQEQPWCKSRKANYQPAYNWAFNKTADQFELYLLSQLVYYSSRIKLGFR